MGRLSRTVANEPRAEQQRQSSLYRRHRPRTFDEVVGQEPVVRTLRNAVERDQVHHAYLFVEMDAASNNSVDDIRELRDSVAFAPVSGRRKVYILDEAHMLSTAAWNAFLKTLEEPPPDTVFVLATTEAQKVPATVVDRCHRFDFQRPTVEQIAQVLRRTAESESIEIPPEAIAALARSATGSFRDALGTLEQLLAYSGSTIALEDVLAVLGVADAQLLERTVDAVAGADARGALLALAECADSGRDAGSFASDLETRIRELMVVQTLGEVPPELALTPEADTRLLAQAERVPHATVVCLLELLGSAMESVRAGADARTSLELALVKASKPEVDASTKALLARIERLEGRGLLRAMAQPVSDTSHPASDASLTPAVATPAPESDLTSEIPPGSMPRDEPAPGIAPAAESPDDAPPPAPTPPVADDLPSIADVWPAVIKLVTDGHALCGAVIADTRPMAIAGEDLTVGFPTSAAFLKKKAEDPSNRQIVTDALRRLAGGRWRISYELREDLDAANGDGATCTYTEDEWIERFKSELDAEELPIEHGPGQGAEPEPATSVAGGAAPEPANSESNGA